MSSSTLTRDPRRRAGAAIVRASFASGMPERAARAFASVRRATEAHRLRARTTPLREQPLDHRASVRVERQPLRRVIGARERPPHDLLLAAVVVLAEPHREV